MTDELVNIVYFLTKQNVQKDMQKEIMKYYQSQKKYRILILDYTDEVSLDENEDYIYYEIIPYGSIDQINLINLYKFIYQDNQKMENSGNKWKVTDYNNEEINFIHKGKKYTWASEEILRALTEDGSYYSFSDMLHLSATIKCYIKTMEF